MLPAIQEKDITFYDNSRLSEFKTCPRKYYFRYILQLVPDRIALALDFGSAWHNGMDALYLTWEKSGGNEEETIQMAWNGFLEEWESRGHPRKIPINMESMYLPRTPGVARELQVNYLKRWMSFLNEIEIIVVELPFAIPLDPDKPNLFYVGRIDKVARYAKKVIGIEHKTSTMFSKADGIQTNVTDLYHNDSQIDGYNYFLWKKYREEFAATYVDLALVHKTHDDIFKHVRVNKDNQSTKVWLSDALYWTEKVDQAIDEDRWPKNAPGGCRTVFGRCNYFSICPYYDANKINLDEVPTGYKREKWEPFSFDELAAAITREREEGDVSTKITS